MDHGERFKFWRRRGYIHCIKCYTCCRWVYDVRSVHFGTKWLFITPYYFHFPVWSDDYLRVKGMSHVWLSRLDLCYKRLGCWNHARYVLTRPHHFALLWKRVFVFLALSIDITELTEQKVLKINMVWNFRTCIFPIRNPYFAPPCLWLFSSTYLMWLVGQRSTYGGHAMVSSGVQDSAVFWSISQEIPVIIEPIFADEEYGMWITRLPNRTGYFTLEREIFHLVTLTLFPVLVVESSHSTGEMRCDVDAW